jgi:hypothetical protein
MRRYSPMAKKKAVRKKAYKPSKYAYEVDTEWHAEFNPIPKDTLKAFNGIASRLLAKVGKAKKKTKR